MFRLLNNPIVKDHVWSRVIGLGVIIFFIFLSDAILSFWVPNFVQETFGSSFIMGLILSFSSVIGLLADFIFPQVARGTTVRLLFLLGIISSFCFALLLIWSVSLPTILILLLAMAVWGIYYEFIGFGEQQFIADSTPLKLHSAAWGVLSTFRSLSYFIGPILAGLLIVRGQLAPLFVALLLTFIGFVILMFNKRKHDRPIEIAIQEVNLLKEVEHWKVLFVHVWPVIILSVFMGLVDATFWTTGAVWSEQLSKSSFWGGMFLPFYTLPSLFMGFVVAKWGIYRGKKKLSEIFLMLSGIFLALLGISDNIAWQLGCVLISSMLLSTAYPLTDGVYSDIVARMGRERRHLIGLSRSTISVAYIVGPALSGFIASQVGERITFSIVGIGVVIISLVLLLTTPKKLKLPQNEIKNWEQKS